MGKLLADLRYGARMLQRSPGFTVVAVLTLALGIGANSAIFSVVNGVILRPLPYAEPDRLVAIASQFPTLGFDKFWISPPEYLELRERSRSYTEIGAYRTGTTSVGGGGSPQRVTSAIATATLFRVLGVTPELGRYYTDDEDLPNAEPVVVLSDGLWRRSFGADPSIIGRSIEVDGVATRVLGVMPPGFDMADADVDLWQPAGLDPANRQNRGSHYLYLVGRLKTGVTREQADSELAGLVRQWADLNPGTHVPRPDTHALFLKGLQEDLVGNVRPALLLLLGAVGFVLLIACANVGNLLLARAEVRGREIAVRTALGAGRLRLLRQFLTESVLLATLGGAIGLLLGYSGVKALLAASPESVPRAGAIAMDGRVVLFTFAVSVLTGLLFGLAPTLHLSARNVNLTLREGGQRTTAGMGRLRLRRLLVVSEVALAVMLVVGAGLMIRSFAALQRVDPGFDARNLLTFQTYLPPATYPDATSEVSFYGRAVEQLRALPGVESAAAMSGLPPRRDVNANDMEIEGFTPTPDGPAQNVDYWQFVTTDYFETMKIPIVSGRTFGVQDGGEAAPVAVINETLARVFYPNQNPIGRRLRPGFGDTPWFTIIGIVKDVKQGGLEENTGTELYFHYPQVGRALSYAPRTMNLVMRTSGDPLRSATAVRREMATLDASLPVAELRSMDDVLERSMAQPRFLTLLLVVFAGVALSLAAIGTYGVMAYSVAERRQEIGVRMALGAQGGGVLRMILGQGAAVAGAGLLLGILGALWMTRLLSSLLFGISTTDTTTFMLAPVVLGAVALVACGLPAWRATRIDPAHVLRQE